MTYTIEWAVMCMGADRMAWLGLVAGAFVIGGVAVKLLWRPLRSFGQ